MQFSHYAHCHQLSDDADDFNTLLSKYINNAANASMPSPTFERKIVFRGRMRSD